MFFNTINYIVFLPIIVLLYFAVPSKYKNAFLLLASVYFYACFDLRFLPFLAAAIIVSYISGIIIEKSEDKKRRYALLLAIFVNVGMLLFFKYTNFFAQNIVAVMNSFGKNITFEKFNIILPMGISFFVFQSLSYVFDVYLKKIKAEKNLLIYSLFICFFVHITSGPIDRAAKLIPQFYTKHSFDYKKAVTGMQLMAIGFFKKIAVADVLVMVINTVHANLYDYSGLMLVFTAFLYSIYLYCDFSGYSDIARGSAAVLGFDIMENFNVPYLSTSFSQFWSRWHISLSSWFQDYIFTPFVWTNPLKKFGWDKPPIIPAIWVVFLTSGLWHGSAWGFVIWGALHAVYRTGEDLMRKYYKKPDKKPKPLKYWGKVIWVFTLVTFSQIFFRTESVYDALYYISASFKNLSLSQFLSQLTLSISVGFDATPLLIYAFIAYCIMAVTVLIVIDCYRNFTLKGGCLTTAFLSMKSWQRWACYYILVFFILAGFVMNNGYFAGNASLAYGGF